MWCPPALCIQSGAGTADAIWGWLPGLRNTPTPVNSSAPALLPSGIAVPRDAVVTWPPEAVPLAGRPPQRAHRGSLHVFCSSAGSLAPLCYVGRCPYPGLSRKPRRGQPSLCCGQQPERQGSGGQAGRGASLGASGNSGHSTTQSVANACTAPMPGPCLGARERAK